MVRERLRVWRDAGVDTVRFYPAGETLDARSPPWAGPSTWSATSRTRRVGSERSSDRAGSVVSGHGGEGGSLCADGVHRAQVQGNRTLMPSTARPDISTVIAWNVHLAAIAVTVGLRLGPGLSRLGRWSRPVQIAATIQAPLLRSAKARSVRDDGIPSGVGAARMAQRDAFLAHSPVDPVGLDPLSLGAAEARVHEFSRGVGPPSMMAERA